jgi:hypothetical protein
MGLSYLVANKQLLAQLEINNCIGISSEGFHCLTTLTNLTNLTVMLSKFDDIGLNMICSSCLLIEYLDVRGNTLITVEGLNNIHCLIHLKTLYIMGESVNWFAKLSHNTALTYLNYFDMIGSLNSTISDEGLSHLSSLVNLTSVRVNCKEMLI